MAPAWVLLSARPHLNGQKDLLSISQCYFHWIQPERSRGQSRQSGKVYITSPFFSSLKTIFLTISWNNCHNIPLWFFYRSCMYAVDRQAHQLWKKMHDTKALGCFCQGNASCAWDGGASPVPTPFSLAGTEHAATQTITRNHRHHPSSLCLIRRKCAYVCVYVSTGLLRKKSQNIVLLAYWNSDLL